VLVAVVQFSFEFHLFEKPLKECYDVIVLQSLCAHFFSPSLCDL